MIRWRRGQKICFFISQSISFSNQCPAQFFVRPFRQYKNFLDFSLFPANRFENSLWHFFFGGGRGRGYKQNLLYSQSFCLSLGEGTCYRSLAVDVFKKRTKFEGNGGSAACDCEHITAVRVESELKLWLQLPHLQLERCSPSPLVKHGFRSPHQ